MFRLKSSTCDWMEINNNFQELQEGATFPKRNKKVVCWHIPLSRRCDQSSTAFCTMFLTLGRCVVSWSICSARDIHWVWVAEALTPTSVLWMILVRPQGALSPLFPFTIWLRGHPPSGLPFYLHGHHSPLIYLSVTFLQITPLYSSQYHIHAHVFSTPRRLLTTVL